MTYVISSANASSQKTKPISEHAYGGFVVQNTLLTSLAAKPYLAGIVGTRPTTSNGALFNTFANRWEDASPDMYTGAGQKIAHAIPVRLTTHNTHTRVSKQRGSGYYKEMILLCNTIVYVHT